MACGMADTRVLAKWLLAASVAVAGMCGPAAWSQVAAPVSQAAQAKPGELGIADWLMRMHAASRARTYIGTFVVSAGSSMSSARIWHVCDGDLQLERVESLSGEPRSTFRRNDQVITFLPQSRTAVAERRESLGLFPDLLRSTDSSIGQFYRAQQLGVERVAGLEADVVLLQPMDSLRFGYRISSEKKSGLVIKLQTLDVDGRVLEQAAFSELQMDAPVNVGKLAQMMDNTDGYRVETPELVKTTAAAEGWAMKNPVAGFRSMSCYRRPASGADAAKGEGAVQWVFSDGLASVSLFAEAFDRRRHAFEGSVAMGATHTLTRRLTDRTGDWWLTVIGEVPRGTLGAFAAGLARTR